MFVVELVIKANFIEHFCDAKHKTDIVSVKIHSILSECFVFVLSVSHYRNRKINYLARITELSVEIIYR